MSKHLAGVLAELLEQLKETDLPSIDQIADVLSDHDIYIEELGEKERGLVDRFLQDAFALWSARE